jgi:WW domain/PH domain
MALAVVQRGFLDVPNSATAKRPKWRQKYFVAVVSYLLVYDKQVAFCPSRLFAPLRGGLSCALVVVISLSDSSSKKPDPKKKSVPKAKLDLRGASAFAKPDYQPRHHVFAIRDKKGKEHLFGAVEADEVARWVKRLNLAKDPNYDPAKEDAQKRGSLASASGPSSRGVAGKGVSSGSANRTSRGPSGSGASSSSSSSSGKPSGGGGGGGGGAGARQPAARQPSSSRAPQASGGSRRGASGVGGERLPPGWEAATDARGRTYYIDHNTRMTTYRSPLTSGVGGKQMPTAVGVAGPTAHKKEAVARDRREAMQRNQAAASASAPRQFAPSAPPASAPPASAPPAAGPSAASPRSARLERLPDLSKAAAGRVRPNLRKISRAELMADLEVDPLPPGWEVKFTGKGRPVSFVCRVFVGGAVVFGLSLLPLCLFLTPFRRFGIIQYFVDHATRQTTFDRPPPVASTAVSGSQSARQVRPSVPPQLGAIGRPASNPFLAPAATAPSAPSAPSAPLVGGADFDAAEMARIQERLAMAAASAPSAPPVEPSAPPAEPSAPPADDSPPAKRAPKGADPAASMMAQLASQAGGARGALKHVSSSESESSSSGDEKTDGAAMANLALPSYHQHVSRHSTIKLSDADTEMLKRAMAGETADSDDGGDGDYNSSDMSDGESEGESSSGASVSLGDESEESEPEFTTDDEEAMAAEIKTKKLQVVQLKRAEKKAEAIALLREVKVMEADLKEKSDERDAQRTVAAYLESSPVADDDSSDDGIPSSSDSDQVPSPMAMPSPGGSSGDDDSGNEDAEEPDNAEKPPGRDARLDGLAGLGSAAAAGFASLRKPSVKAPSPPASSSSSEDDEPASTAPVDEDSDSASVPSMSGDEVDVPDFADDSDDDGVAPPEAPRRDSPSPPDSPTDSAPEPSRGDDDAPAMSTQDTFTKADIEQMRKQMEEQIRAEMKAQLAAEQERIRAELLADMKKEG